MEKNKSKKVSHKNSGKTFVKLDINKLGRPYHKIPSIFTERLDLLDIQFSHYFLKKYKMSINIEKIKVTPDHLFKNSLIFHSNIGNLGFDIDRSLLHNILNNYYGLSKEYATPFINKDEPITKTEERLKLKLGSELVGLFIDTDLFYEKLSLQYDSSHIISQWAYSVTLNCVQHDGCKGNINILFDNQHINSILLKFRKLFNNQINIHLWKKYLLEKIIPTIPIKLNAELLKYSMPLQRCLSLKNGDVIPISFPDKFPIFIGEKQLMTASIAENKSKLYLTYLIENKRNYPYGSSTN